MTDWAERLWREAEHAASGLSGDAVVRVLAAASQDVWAAGLDHAFADMVGDKLVPESAGNFDVTWLSIFVVKLHAAKRQ